MHGCVCKYMYMCMRMRVRVYACMYVFMTSDQYHFINVSHTDFSLWHCVLSVWGSWYVAYQIIAEVSCLLKRNHTESCLDVILEIPANHLDRKTCSLSPLSHRILRSGLTLQFCTYESPSRPTVSSGNNCVQQASGISLLASSFFMCMTPGFNVLLCRDIYSISTRSLIVADFLL